MDSDFVGSLRASILEVERGSGDTVVRNGAFIDVIFDNEEEPLRRTEDGNLNVSNGQMYLVPVRGPNFRRKFEKFESMAMSSEMLKDLEIGQGGAVNVVFTRQTLQSLLMGVGDEKLDQVFGRFLLVHQGSNDNNDKGWIAKRYSNTAAAWLHYYDSPTPFHGTIFAEQEKGLKQNFASTKLSQSQRVTSKETESSKDAVIASITFGPLQSSLRLADLKVLGPGQYLNDDMLDFGLALGLQKAGIDPKEVIFMSALSFQLMFKPLENPLPGRTVRGLYRSLTSCGANLQQVKYIGLPVCREKHWLLIIMCNPFPDERILIEADKQVPNQISRDEKRRYWLFVYTAWLEGRLGPKPIFLVFDSSFAKAVRELSNYDMFIGNTVDFVKRGMLTLHEKFWEEKKPGSFCLDMSEVRPLLNYQIMRKMPQQPNNCDCGFFLMEYAVMWLTKVYENSNDYWDIIHKDIDFAQEVDPHSICANRKLIQGAIANLCQEQFPAHHISVIKEFETINSSMGLKDELYKNEEQQQPRIAPTQNSWQYNKETYNMLNNFPQLYMNVGMRQQWMPPNAGLRMPPRN